MLKMGILDRLRNLNKNQPDVFQETWFEKCNNAYGCYRTRSSSDANTANLHIEEGMSIEWIERFPDLPFKLANVKAYYYSGPKNVLLLDDADISLAYNLIASTKPIFIDSYNLVPEIPRIVFRKVYIVPGEDDPLNSNYMFLMAHPFTPTGRNKKYPISIHADYSDRSGRISIRAFVMGDGNIGKVEIGIQKGSQPYPIWSIYARLEDSGLVVDRIAKSDSDGTIKTMFTLGR